MWVIDFNSCMESTTKLVCIDPAYIDEHYDGLSRFDRLFQTWNLFQPGGSQFQESVKSAARRRAPEKSAIIFSQIKPAIYRMTYDLIDKSFKTFLLKIVTLKTKRLKEMSLQTTIFAVNVTHFNVIYSKLFYFCRGTKILSRYKTCNTKQNIRCMCYSRELTRRRDEALSSGK